MKDIELIKKGFNAGYLLQKHDPELARKLFRGLKDLDTPYAEGYRAGIKEYERERLTRKVESMPKRTQGKDMDLGR